MKIKLPDDPDDLTPDPPGDPNAECKKSTSGEHGWANGLACGPGGSSTQITVCVFCGAIQ